jgi:hypothetical protein
MGQKSPSAERRSRAFGLDLVAVSSEIVVLMWCSPYYQTRSRGRVLRTSPIFLTTKVGE